MNFDTWILLFYRQQTALIVLTCEGPESERSLPIIELAN